MGSSGAESSRRPPRHRRDICTMAWRCGSLTDRKRRTGCSREPIIDRRGVSVAQAAARNRHRELAAFRKLTISRANLQQLAASSRSARKTSSKAPISIPRSSRTGQISAPRVRPAPPRRKPTSPKPHEDATLSIGTPSGKISASTICLCRIKFCTQKDTFSRNRCKWNNTSGSNSTRFPSPHEVLRGRWHDGISD